MHIILTVNTAWNIWNFRRPLVRALLKEGHRLTVLAPRDQSVPDLQALGCAFVPLPMDVKGVSPLRDFALFQRLRRHFRALAPDVILSFTIKNNVYGALAARALGVTFIPNVTGLGTAFLSSGFLRGIAENLYRFAFARLPVIFFQNADDRDLFLKQRLVRPDQARLLPGSGIDLERFAPQPLPGKPTVQFLMIARLLRDKGVVEYAEAVRVLRAEGIAASFQLLGPLGAENRSAIPESLLAGWQADATLQYLGETEDVRSAIAAADCAVLPSYREGAPRTLIEAASMARPLIATDVPGCREVVRHGVNGYLCRIQDSASLADAMRRLVDDGPSVRESMGRESRRLMERAFDQDIVVRRYLDAIRETKNRTSAVLSEG